MSNTSVFETSAILQFLNNLSLSNETNIIDRIGQFSLSDERVLTLTGLSSQNLIHLSNKLSSMRNMSSRSIIQALVVFLFKLKTGNSNNVVAATFGIEREQKVSDYCTAVMNSFEKDILPVSLGIHSCSRDDLIQNHTTPYAKTLHGVENELVIIWDSTYIRHEKSTNHVYQRKAYSGHKKVPLCKRFTICCTDGYVIDIPGPFYVTQNDAEILKHVLINEMLRF